MEVVVGSYEQVAFGFSVQPSDEDDGLWNLEPSFTHHGHIASLTAVSVGKKYLATGSRDETIKLYDLKKRVEYGELQEHEGTITCLEFFGDNHLLSGAEDGNICLWEVKSWECVKTLHAHKGRVMSFSVHPSGKLALSVGSDKTLRTWNLMKGRSAFVKNIKQIADLVLWSPKGDFYIVSRNNQVDVYKLETASVVWTFSIPVRISSVRFITESIVAVCGDYEKIHLYDVQKQACVCEFKAHDLRIKALHYSYWRGIHILLSASNDGYIKLWNIDLSHPEAVPILLGEINTTARLTCLTVHVSSDETQSLDSSVGKGRKRKKVKEEKDVEHLDKEAVETSEDGIAKTMPSQADAQDFSKCLKG
uniref:p21-activated protein kinase-interacting protein 1 n=1 Tax=Myxine glutinosa TaxID=7769 RepID=UPI00358FA214